MNGTNNCERTNGIANGFYQKNGIQRSLRIAIIGQSAFAAEVYEVLKEQGHNIVGAFTIADKNGREDPLAIVAKNGNTPVFKYTSWRKNRITIPEVFEQYKSVNAELNVMPYCSQFIPQEVVEWGLGSICYHPSILPRHRGASAISWTLIEGDERAGLSIFWADDGLDTGPILMQKQCEVLQTDTLDSLYKRFLYPEGVRALAESTALIANGKAPKIQQSEVGATYDPILTKKENQIINWSQSAKRLFNFIRALDSVPGAVAYFVEDEEIEVRLFGASILEFAPKGDGVNVKGLNQQAIVHENGIAIRGTDGRYVNIKRIKMNGRMMNASEYFTSRNSGQQEELVLTPDEEENVETLRKLWKGVLGTEIDDETDFFACGGGSMDVVRIIEEIKEAVGVTMENEDLYMNPTFGDFTRRFVTGQRDGGSGGGIEFEGVEIKANGRICKVATQLFIGGQFVNAENNNSLKIYNPTTEEVICNVQAGSKNDVDLAVRAANAAFKGAWSAMSPRQRGLILLKLADLMEEHKEELATIESVDSGAVYTLALKTHVGMSIEVWRYFAGWADKIEGATLPVTPNRPNGVLSFTRKEPVGVCGLVTPWNYPLMMLSWKMAACLAAGNTVVMKPAQVCPLTALKFAELAAKAGVPAGVINIVPGKGSQAGQAIVDHPLIRKVGFTGSTEVGKGIMSSAALANLKKVSLELGGKSPLVIFRDCDLEKAVKIGMQSVFFNKGENCISAGRLYVEDSIHDEFVRRVCHEVRKMKIGDPLDRGTSHGPQNHREHMEKLQEFCKRGVEEGAKLEIGGDRMPMKGFFFAPTVFSGVTDDMYIAQEESFGPIMVVLRFDESDLDAVIARANDTEFGLAAGVFTSDMSKALRFAEKVEAGTVFVNTYNKTDVGAPFGGFKQSGFGKDLGREALNEYLKTKCVTIEY